MNRSRALRLLVVGLVLLASRAQTQSVENMTFAQHRKCYQPFSHYFGHGQGYDRNDVFDRGNGRVFSQMRVNPYEVHTYDAIVVPEEDPKTNLVHLWTLHGNQALKYSFSASDLRENQEKIVVLDSVVSHCKRSDEHSCDRRPLAVKISYTTHEGKKIFRMTSVSDRKEVEQLSSYPQRQLAVRESGSRLGDDRLNQVLSEDLVRHVRSIPERWKREFKPSSPSDKSVENMYNRAFTECTKLAEEKISDQRLAKAVSEVQSSGVFQHEAASQGQSRGRPAQGTR